MVVNLDNCHFLEITYKKLKMSRFSGVLQLTDLDDFITPSQVFVVLHNLR